MCQAITLLTASVPLLAGSPPWPSSCRSHCCPVSGYMFMCDWNIVNMQRGDARQVAGQRHVHEVAEDLRALLLAAVAEVGGVGVVAAGVDALVAAQRRIGARDRAASGRCAVVGGRHGGDLPLEVADLVEVARQPLLVGASRASGSTSASAGCRRTRSSTLLRLRSRKSWRAAAAASLGGVKLLNSASNAILRADHRLDRQRVAARRVRLVRDHVAAVGRRDAQVPLDLDPVDQRLERRVAGDRRRRRADPTSARPTPCSTASARPTAAGSATTRGSRRAARPPGPCRRSRSGCDSPDTTLTSACTGAAARART